MKKFADERGASPVSVIVVLTILMLIMELIVMGGRVAAAHNDISSAAREAARQGSLAQGPGSVQSIVQGTTNTNLGGKCQSVDSRIDGTNFDHNGHVTATVECTVDLSGLSLLSLPYGSKTFTATHTEIVETYRVIGS